MNNLPNNKLTLNSREVAGMVGKRHSDLLRDIENYISYISQNAKLRSDDFFIESSYKAGTGKNYKCYQVTKKGCEFIAHKLTGQKGAEFTATYINRFHEMEEHLQPQTIEDLIILQAQSMKQMKEKVNKVESQVAAVKQSLAEVKDNWRQYVNGVFAKIGRATGDYEGFRKESYILLDRRAHSDIEKRLANKLERMEKNGATKTAIRQTNKLDVIDEDPKLKEIYVKIVQEMEAKYL